MTHDDYDHLRESADEAARRTPTLRDEAIEVMPRTLRCINKGCYGVREPDSRFCYYHTVRIIGKR